MTERVLFTFAEVAEMTALKESWLRRATAEQRIRFHRIGKHIRFTHDDIAALIAQAEVPPAVSPVRRLPRSA